jgi:hypothetical protein
MSNENLTDEFIAVMQAMAKTVENPGARGSVKGCHDERNYDVVSKDGKSRFTLLVRQSRLMPHSFSCGLRWRVPAGGEVILVRYNGSDHPHKNSIEGDKFDNAFHIHLATARYAAASKRVEHFAETTTRFCDVAGALQCLLADWNIAGLPSAEGGHGPQGVLL